MPLCKSSWADALAQRLDLITFCLAEPNVLGFFPYQTESPTTEAGAGITTGSTGSDDVEGDMAPKAAAEEDGQ